MKKVVLLLTLALISGSIFAQKANVSKAKAKAYSEEPDFAGAHELIKAALEDETTKNEANTWYVAGLVGYLENEAMTLAAQYGQQVDEAKKGQTVVESYDYFIKADQLGQIPDEKGKVNAKVRRDVKSKLVTYFTNQTNLISYGAYLFENNKDYAGAYNVFKRYLDIPKLDMFADEKSQKQVPQDSTYNMIKYFSALAASNAGMTKEAIATLEDLKDDNYETMTVYQLLYQEYLTLKDTANYVSTLKQGIQLFPKEPWFLQNLINHFVFTNQNEEALSYLNAAIAAEPMVADYHYVKGNMEESLGNYDEALKAFEKAVELKPDLVDAYAGMGRVYYNQAVKVNDAALNLDAKDIDAYTKAEKEMNDLFRRSLPFFEKAYQMNKEDDTNKRILLNLYYRLGMEKEYDALSNE